jgi:hypothetical protein
MFKIIFSFKSPKKFTNNISYEEKKNLESDLASFIEK